MFGGTARRAAVPPISFKDLILQRKNRRMLKAISPIRAIIWQIGPSELYLIVT